MHDIDRVIDAFRNCITEPQCRDCPWHECEQLGNKKVEIPVDLCLEVMNLLATMYPKMITRSRCGLDVPEGGRSCPRCGEAVSQDASA